MPTQRRHSVSSLVLAPVLTVLVAGGCTPNTRPPESAPPPSLAFDAPTENSVLHGVVTVSVTTKGSAEIKTLRFLAPAELGSAAAAYDPATRSATISAPLDLSTYPDGPLKITVAATDALGGKTSKELAVTVAQHAPVIVVSQPASAGTVAGVISIIASATAQTGASITSLELTNPPPGAGADAQPTANALTIVWDTTKAPEGPVALHFRATDSTGLSADSTINVVVDNVPQGKIDAYVSAGAPIEGAGVDVFALDAATGVVTTAVGSNGLIGHAGPTDASGRVTITMTEENYSGPIQLVAKATAGSSLSYTDPTNPPRSVSIPDNLPLTTILSFYKAGSSISAPVTLWTTLADAEIAAYAAGAHRQYPTHHSLAEAATFADGLFAAHLQASTPTWSLRTTIPALLTQPPTQSLTDRTYAAFADVALAQLAQDLGAATNARGLITAPYLVQLFRRDLLADGQFDGRGEGGVALQTGGEPVVALSEDDVRVKLAVALDEFILSTRNQTGLTRADMTGAGIYNTITNDTSALFGPKPTTSFDNQPPVPSITVTFGPSNAAPVGTNNFVRGVVRVSVAASDASGVQSIALTADGGTIPATYTQGAGSATLVATYNTAAHADGILTFAVTATDGRSNTSAPITYSVTVDNKAPDINIVQPLSTTWYNGAIVLEATAADATSSVASCTETTSGAVDQDGAPARFLGSYTPAGGNAVVSFVFSACDIVGNCATKEATANRDIMPPTVTLVRAPPRYVRGSVVSFAVSASDKGAGVTGVFVKLPGDATPQKLRENGSEYTINFSLPSTEGSYALIVWATDAAGNGGENTSITIPVVADWTPPAPTPNTRASSYYDERSMTLASAGVPPTYQFPQGAAKLAVLANNEVWKSASRLHWTLRPGADVWTSRPTAAELEGANPDNIPFVQVYVPTDGVTAPISSATYSISVNGGAPITGEFPIEWRSPNPPPGNAAYDLPLTADIIPALDTAPGVAKLTISATFVDEAGNPGMVSLGTVDYNIVGPPLSVTRDDNYAAARDPRSPHAYLLSTRSYTAFWTEGTLFPGGNVRLVRYVVSNPTSVPVAVSTTFSGSATSTETWRRWRATYLNNGTRVDAWDFVTEFYVDNYTNILFPMSNCNVNAAPDYLTNSRTVIHKFGTSARFECALPTDYPWGVYVDRSYSTDPWLDPYTGVVDYPWSQSTSTIRAAAFRNPTDAASETVEPAMVGGLPIVPAAAGNQPGQIVIYLARPFSARSIDDTTYDGQPDALVYALMRVVSGGSSGRRVYSLYQVNRRIVGASEAINGTVSMTPQAVRGDSLVGTVGHASVDTLNATLTTFVQ